MYLNVVKNKGGQKIMKRVIVFLVVAMMALTGCQMNADNENVNDYSEAL